MSPKKDSKASKESHLPDSSRRVFVKRVAYVAPTLLTFSAVASMAQPGSGMTQNDPPRV